MGNLSTLYISQSFQSLLHFGTNWTASTSLIEIQDGSGSALGLYLNTGGDLLTTHSISSSIIEATNFIVKNKIEVSGSVDINGPVTASNAFIKNDLIVSGTIFAKEVHTLIESSSIIYSTGSNILGDSVLDTQTLNGSIIMSGSSSLTGSSGITGNLSVGGFGNFGGSGSFVGNLTATGNISSSTLSGVGNVTLYSQSVDYRLDNLEAYSGSAETKFAAIQTYTSSMNVYTQSVNAQIYSLQQFTASVGLVTTASYNAYTTSTNARLDSIEIATSSLQIFSASAKIELANLESTTASLNSSVSNLNLFTASNGIASLNTYTSSNNTKWTTLGNLTGSYATTGSNTFVANQIISGSLRANVGVLTIAGGTASMDCSLGNFFTLNLPSSSTTALTATNIQPGQTISLKIKQLATSGATTGSLTYPTYIKFPQYGNYNPSPFSGAVDVLSFVAFDTTTLYAVNVRNMNY
jgi:hypothetical protein